MDRRPERHFVVVRTRATVRGDRTVDFTVQGFDEATAKANPLQQGDKLAVYLTSPICGFIATVEISGPRFVSHNRIWESRKDPSQLYPVRYPATRRVILPDEEAVPFIELIDDLDFSINLVNRDRWGGLFLRAIRGLTSSDFRLIEQKLRAREAMLEARRQS
jgi:hypothetical protein